MRFKAVQCPGQAANGIAFEVLPHQKDRSAQRVGSCSQPGTCGPAKLRSYSGSHRPVRLAMVVDCALLMFGRSPHCVPVFQAYRIRQEFGEKLMRRENPTSSSGH
jgi:hypothetical protein